MCWIGIKDNINVQIADKDIEVYKIVLNANKQSCTSIIMGYNYTVNTPYYIPTIEYEVFGFKCKEIKIKKAYHSYTGIHFICGSFRYSIATKSKGMFFGNREVRIPLENKAYIATFIIPKGATYIINAQGEVASDKIIYTGRYLKL
jgi:hypothetical protein